MGTPGLGSRTDVENFGVVVARRSELEWRGVALAWNVGVERRSEVVNFPRCETGETPNLNESVTLVERRGCSTLRCGVLTELYVEVTVPFLNSLL